MSSFDGVTHKVPADLGVEVWQAIVDLLPLPEVVVSYNPYPPMDFKQDMPAWAQHFALNAEKVGTQGVYVFMQQLFFDGEKRVLNWPEFYLPMFLAREMSADHSSGKPIPVRNDHYMMELLQEQFLRCRYVPTFQNGDPLPGLECCHRPFDCVHKSG